MKEETVTDGNLSAHRQGIETLNRIALFTAGTESEDDEDEEDDEEEEEEAEEEEEEEEDGVRKALLPTPNRFGFFQIRYGKSFTQLVLNFISSDPLLVELLEQLRL